MVLGLIPAVRRGVHFCHVSERVEIELIRDAKERGLPVTCEVAPHHLYLTEDDLPALQGFGNMKPPLKRREDVDALWANIDVVDMIATDHAPHTLAEKQSSPAPFGVPGLETSLPLMLTAVDAGKISLDRVVEMMYEAPGRIFGLPVQPETYVEIEPAQRWTISAAAMQTKSRWTPFDGMSVVGAVRNVALRGEIVVRDGLITAAPGSGLVITPVA
jgi:carbamoyl-phosphate synthase/aspartate carbamoyltransferase/dihydroorotase